MRILEYGEKNKPSVLLIHGMGCTGERSFGSSVERLQENYRVILPLLDGYDGDNTTFDTIEAQAARIAAFSKAEYNGSVTAVLGMSMGGFIALELLLRHTIRTNQLILDSGYLPPMRFPGLIASCVAAGFDSIIRGHKRPVVRLGMKMVMGFCFRRQDLCLDATKKTIYNSKFSCLTYALPPLPGGLADCDMEYWYGEKEPQMMKGMHLLKSALPQMRQVDMGSVGHGEIMFTDPQRYACLVEKAFSCKKNVYPVFRFLLNLGLKTLRPKHD